jgi:hypothetical protein
VDGSGSGQGKVLGSCKRGDEPSSSINGGNFLSSLGQISSSGRTVLHVGSYVWYY